MSRSTSAGLGRIREGSEVAGSWRKLRVRPDLADWLNSQAHMQKVTATAVLNRLIATAAGASMDGLAEGSEITAETPT